MGFLTRARPQADQAGQAPPRAADASRPSGDHPSRVDALAKSVKPPKGFRGEAWGILNPYGDLWTHETFDSPEECHAYVERFWRGIDTDTDLRRFKAIRVKVHVTATAKAKAEAIIAARAGEQ